VMNCLLAASSTLTLKTYTVCTALSLFKVIIHTSLVTRTLFYIWLMYRSDIYEY
jgi:hypothetical protein